MENLCSRNLTNYFLNEEISLNETITAWWHKKLDIFNVSFDPSHSKKIVQEYLDDYDLQSLKEYMFFLRAIIEQDEAGSAIKSFVRSLPFGSGIRKSYVAYKREIYQLFKYAESEISRLEGRPFDFEAWYNKTENELARSTTITNNRMNTVANGVYVADRVYSAMNPMK